MCWIYSVIDLCDQAFLSPRLCSPGEDVEVDDPGYDTQVRWEMSKVVENIGKMGGF